MPAKVFFGAVVAAPGGLLSRTSLLVNSGSMFGEPG